MLTTSNFVNVTCFMLEVFLMFAEKFRKTSISQNFLVIDAVFHMTLLLSFHVLILLNVLFLLLLQNILCIFLSYY